MAGLEGRTLGRYTIKQAIGRGGMADVYLADDASFGRRVAVKVFKREDEDMLRRFIREAQLMAKLSNPHLMPVYDTGESVIGGLSYYYIVMPFMDGGTLRTRIRRGPIPLNEICYYMRAIADALDYVHAQGIIHRDIKASNVLLSTKGACYLADFGIARMTTEATQLTSTGNVLGTVDYVAPELFEPHRRADALSDLYSLGVLLYELVTRHLPFSAENQIALVAMHMNRQPPSPRLYVPTLPPQVEQVIFTSLAKLPEQRYQSATELAEAFCHAATVRGVLVDENSDIYENEMGVDGVGDSGGAAYAQEKHFAPYADLANALTVAAPKPAVASESPAVGQGRASTSSHQQATPVRTSPRRKRKRATPEQARVRAVTIIALLALLAVVGPMIYVATHFKSNTNNGPPATTVAQQSATTTRATSTAGASSPTANTTATTQAAANATQQAKNATATAIAGVAATAQAKASATAGVMQTATAGTVLYQDPLTDGNSANVQTGQWDQNGNCTFKQDGYHITVGTDAFDKGQIQGCREDANTYANFAASVDMSILSGHSGGIFFRLGLKTLNAYSGYLFEVRSDGNYKISASGNFSTGAGNTILQDWTPSKALKTGMGTNTLQIIARSGEILFYVNGTYLITIQDSTFTQGKVAFLASSSNGGANAEVVYSNLKITKIA